MRGDLPELYFRVRDKGALVFRLDAGNRNRRLEMEQIATVNVRTGEVKPQGGQDLTDDDRAAVAAWVEARQTLLQRRQTDDIHRTIDQLNLTAQWAQSATDDADLDAVTEALLLAMHDLRTVLVRRQAERLSGADEE